ncbi:unnamed protein product [Hydatigera taeniaeformis]|uniref:Uncharacterized protein n=1 Tax=Hydatigena taeniaeformis TaxID=6205 RepID=A0A0R3WV06_HYDTA|nr:unnamed protein product [Hydatigera taeniaeformis]
MHIEEEETVHAESAQLESDNTCLHNPVGYSLTLKKRLEVGLKAQGEELETVPSPPLPSPTLPYPNLLSRPVSSRRVRLVPSRPVPSRKGDQTILVKCRVALVEELIGEAVDSTAYLTE